MSTPAVEEILGQLPMSQIAAQLGVDTDTATQAAAAAIPSLIGGLAHNADHGQEDAVAAALSQHGSSDLLGAGPVDLSQVDTEDGSKIVQHVFGEQSTQLAHAIGQRTGAGGGVVSRLLPILAPIVLAYLAKKVPGGQQSGGGMLGGILGGILSGGGLGSVLIGRQAPQSQEPAPASPQDPAPSGDSGGYFNPTPVHDAGSLSVDATPSPEPEGQQETPAESQNAPQQPQSSSSIVDEILGGLFGKR